MEHFGILKICLTLSDIRKKFHIPNRSKLVKIEFLNYISLSTVSLKIKIDNH